MWEGLPDKWRTDGGLQTLGIQSMTMIEVDVALIEVWILTGTF